MDFLFYFIQTISTEISEYSSDSENLEECQAENSNLELPKKFRLHFGAGVEMDTERSASDWLKTAQAFLQTPKKKLAKNVRTPEDSAKKRKLLRYHISLKHNFLLQC